MREKGNLVIGDLVLVVDDNSPRGRWLLGRVIKTLPGPDDRVREAEIKTSTSTLTRPISKLCLLEEAALGTNAIFAYLLNVYLHSA